MILSATVAAVAALLLAGCQEGSQKGPSSKLDVSQGGRGAPGEASLTVE